jgi:transcriptional regulator with XRE-family HTH domain
MTPASTQPNIKLMLRERRLSQAEVARRMGVSAAHLSRLLTTDPAQQRGWPLRIRRAFAQATGIPMREIWGDENGASLD